MHKWKHRNAKKAGNSPKNNNSSVANSKDVEMVEILKNSKVYFSKWSKISERIWISRWNKVVNSRLEWVIQQFEWEVQQRDRDSEKKTTNRYLKNKSSANQIKKLNASPTDD
jgi:hypothetical protein